MPSLSTKALYQTAAFMGKAVSVTEDNIADNFQFKLPVVASVVDLTVANTQTGTLFSNEGATEAEIVFTLPAPTDAASEGSVFFFYVAEDLAVKITSGTADLLIAQNDVAATSVSWETTSLMVGGAGMVVGDGAKWFFLNLSDGNTLTIA